MPLTLNKFPVDGGEISKGDFTNPVNWVLAVTDEQQILEQKLYLRMDNPSEEYCTEGTLYAVDDSGSDESSWYQFAVAKDNGPFVEPGPGPGDFSDLIEFEVPLNGEVPIWVRLTVPSRIEAEPKIDLRIAADYITHNN